MPRGAAALLLVPFTDDGGAANRVPLGSGLLEEVATGRRCQKRVAELSRSALARIAQLYAGCVDRAAQGRAEPDCETALAGRIEQTADGHWKVKLRVRQEHVPESFRMYVPVTLELGKKKQLARFRVKVEGPLTEIELPPVPTEPRKVTFDDLEGVLAEVKTAGWD